MATPFEWEDSTTSLSYTNLNKMIDANHMNLVKNSNMLSWAAGTSTAPDGYTFAGDGTIARDATYFQTGKYSAKITMASTDTTEGWLYHDIEGAMGGYFQGREITVAALVRVPVADKVRLLISDGVGTTYSSYSAGPNTWEVLSVNRTLNGSATQVHIALENIRPVSSSYDAYIDSMYAWVGQLRPELSVNPLDHAPFISGHENDGTFEEDVGGWRMIPFTHSFTATGGTTTEETSYTFQTSAPDVRPKIIHAAYANCTDSGGTGPDEDEVLIAFMSFASTGFSMKLHSQSGNFTASDTVTVKGVVIARGWNDWEDIYGSF